MSLNKMGEAQEILNSRFVDVGIWGGRMSLLDALLKLHDFPRSVAAEVGPGIVIEEALMRIVLEGKIVPEDMMKLIKEHAPELGEWKAHYIAFDGLRNERTWSTNPS